jgi:hypothetical protein
MSRAWFNSRQPHPQAPRHQGLNSITQFRQALQIDLTGEYKTKRPPSASFLSLFHVSNRLSGTLTKLIARPTLTNMPP